jgi:DNA repair exonuclease SbcCD ATPase subunit
MLKLARLQPASQHRNAECFARPARQQQHRTSVRSGVSGEGVAMVVVSAVAGAGLKAFVDHYMTTDKKVEDLRKTTDEKVDGLSDKYHALDKDTCVILKGIAGQLVSISSQLQQQGNQLQQQGSQLQQQGSQLQKQGSQLQSLQTDIPHIYKLLEHLPSITKQLEVLQRMGPAQPASS